MSCELYKKYPQGLVAYVTKGKVPDQCRGLAKYLAKYVASPPIAIRRIVSCTGDKVTYWYNDHQTKAKEVVTVDVVIFIGRMVQHILPEGFQRIRYYGLQATKTFRKWVEAIKEGLRRIGRLVKGAYEVVAGKSYRERYQEMSGQDPLKCRHCGREMELWRIWHPRYGIIYDEWEKIKAGKYERTVESEDTPTGCGGYSLWPPPEEYNYRCSRCGCEVWVNEAIIDFDLGFAEFEGREPAMPVLGCPGCNRETMEYTGIKSSPEGR